MATERSSPTFGDGRPSILTETFTSHSPIPTESDQRRLKIILGTTLTILKILPEREVFLLARDMDDIYDALELVISKLPNAKLLWERVHRLQVSRAVAANSSPEQLIPWMDQQGLRARDIASGRQKVAIVDIGWIGRIPKAIYRTVVATSETTSAATTLEVLKHYMPVYLLGPYGRSSFSELEEDVTRGRLTNRPEVIRAVENERFYFPSLFSVDQDIRTRTFGNASDGEIYSEISSYIKSPKRHLEGRGLNLSADGRQIIKFDRDSGDSRISQQEHNRFRHVLYNYFSSPQTLALATGAPQILPLLKEAEKPSVTRSASLLDSDVQTYVQKNGGPTSYLTPEVLNAYEGLVGELLKQAATQQIFLVARDMEDIYDALKVSILSLPNGEELMKRVTMLRVSRKIAENSNPTQIVNWLKSEGVPIDAIAEGKTKVLVLDTGYASTVFNAIFRSIFQFYQNVPNPRSIALNFLNGLQTRLLASSGHSALADVIAEVSQSQEVDLSRLSNKFGRHKFYFPELLESAEQYERVGLPGDNAARINWLINKVERARRNWHPRALRLTAAGTQIAEYEAADMRDARIDRLAVVLNQRILYEFFSSRDVQKRLAPMLEKLNFLKEGDTNLASKWDTDSLRIGQRIKTKEGKDLEILELIHDGQKARVYKTQDVDTKKLIALKTVKARSCEECIKSLAKSVAVFAELEKTSIIHSKVLEVSEFYIVKEWIDGMTAYEWISGWTGTEMSNTKEYLRLQAKLKYLKAHGIYISNLGPRNLAWNGSEWAVIDSGSVLSATADEVETRFAKNFSDRWVPHLPRTCLNVFERILK